MTEIISKQELQQSVGARLRSAREAKNLKQKDLADLTGTSISYISDIERGTSLMSLTLLIPLKRNFSLNLEWLLEGEGPMFSEEATPTQRVAEPPTPYETATQSDYTQYETARTPEEIAKASKGNVKAVLDAGAPLRAMKTQLQKLEEENKLLRARLDQTDHILSLLHITVLEKHEEEEHKKEKEPA